MTSHIVFVKIGPRFGATAEGELLKAGNKDWLRLVVAAAMMGISMLQLPVASAGEVNGDWRLYGLNASEQRYSPLTQIDRASVGRLGLAWSIDLPISARTLQATPLEVDGVLYFTASLSVVYAVDATSGRELWRHDPEVWKFNPQGLRISQGIHRGVAYDQGAVLVGTTDGRLISLNAKSGMPNWTIDTFEEADSRKQITSAPRVFNGKVIIGNAGADFGTRGYVTAYDAKTGKRAWRFYTVPGNPANGFEDQTQAMAAKTWGGEWWRWGGGGTAWNGITFDQEFNRVYVGTGNSSNYNSAQRSPGGGDNLFLASIVALDADTGKYVWHYQVNPREAWDFKATADMVLADLEIDGKPRKVLMQAPTNGFFYVIDRVTGKLISAEKLGKVTWAERIDLATGRPVESPNIRYQQGPVSFWPSPFGVHNWQAMSFNPVSGLMFIPTMKLGATYSISESDAADAEKLVVGARRYWYPIGASFAIAKVDPDDATGALVAWDPVAQKARWRVKQPTPWNGGTLATASDLVFQGTADGWFHVYDGASGRELRKFQAGNGIIAPPVTYSVNGEQYVAVLAGYSHQISVAANPGWRYRKNLPRALAFKLGGRASMPSSPAPETSVYPVDDPSLPIDIESAKRGENAFNHACTVCHGGGGGVPVGMPGPDLRESVIAHNFAAFRMVVNEGARVSAGMPMFDERSDAELRDLFMYVRSISRLAAQDKLQTVPQKRRARRELETCARSALKGDFDDGNSSR